MILVRHIAYRALMNFIAALTAVVALFLVVDFAENASAFRGEGWVSAVLELYLNQSAVIAYQMAPAAMLLAAALTASGLRRTREYTAMRALGLGPWRVALPVAALATAVALTFTIFDDVLVVNANRRAEEIMVQRFKKYGTWSRWNEQKHWFRGKGGRRIYHLRDALPDRPGFALVSVFEMTDDFQLARRLDAQNMVPVATPGEWLLGEVHERTFAPDGTVTLAYHDHKIYQFDEDPKAFSILPGRPSQMRRATLLSQIRLRRYLGLPVADYELEWNNKMAYPLAGIPVGLLALALALRRERKGHITAALTEAVVVSIAFWLTQGICWSMGLSGRLSPTIAAWTPDAVFACLGAAALKRYA
jgi:lipopolysaccharide export system permease protein